MAVGRSCIRCGARMSRYAHPDDQFCAPCHPTIEQSHDDYCREGHDQTVHGVFMLAGRGRLVRRCAACRREQQRKYTVNRIKRFAA